MIYCVCPVGWTIFWYFLVMPAMHRERKYRHRHMNKYFKQGRSWKLLHRNKTTWIDTRDAHHYTWIHPKPCTRYLKQYRMSLTKLPSKSRTKPSVGVFQQLKGAVLGMVFEICSIHRDLWLLMTSIVYGICIGSWSMLFVFVDVCREGSKPPDVTARNPSPLRRRPTLNLAF